MRSSEKFHRRMQPVINTALTITIEIKNKCVKYITKQISLLAVYKSFVLYLIFN